MPENSCELDQYIWEICCVPKSETALAPKLSPFTQLLLIMQRNSPPSLSAPFSLFLFLLSFLMGPLSCIQQRTILKVYQQFLVKSSPSASYSLCRVSFPSSLPPWGLIEKRALSWPSGEKMVEFISCCVGDKTLERDTSKLRLQAKDSFFAFSLSYCLQCLLFAVCHKIMGPIKKTGMPAKHWVFVCLPCYI